MGLRDAAKPCPFGRIRQDNKEAHGVHAALCSKPLHHTANNNRLLRGPTRCTQGLSLFPYLF